MARLFFLSPGDQQQLKLVKSELSRVDSRIKELDPPDRQGYMLPSLMLSEFTLFMMTGGDVTQEEFILNNHTTLQYLKRLLFVKVKYLKELQKIKKIK